MSVHEEARVGFGTARAVAAYERGRPGYPPEAMAELVSVLAIGRGATVLDLAAGSGKLTRQLLPAGAGLVAVEPSRAMRERLAAAAPGVRVLEGTAEAIPLPDGSVDAVTVGQAFHWFDGPRAVAELHRVLRPGGRVGLLWNVRDESVPWMARITAIVDRQAGDTPRYRDGRWRAAFDASAGFTPLQLRRFPHRHELDREGLRDRFASISFVAALPDATRASVLAEIDQVVAAEPSLAGPGPVMVPYRTELFWAERRDPADATRRAFPVQPSSR
jgi:ubiquinone/menaquinone biosynthesis C-methylase UbiE